MNYCELQAIVLAAGRGSRMTELTTLTPKCLLPIANKPMIYYPLLSLVQANFKEAIVIISKNQEYEIKESIDNLLNIKLEFFTISPNEDYGTADSLRLLCESNKIKTDFLVISCDFISDFPLIKLINHYRIYDASLTSLVSSFILASEGVIPGYKKKGRLEKDLIGIDHSNNDRLVFLSSEADFEEEFPISLSMLKQCPCFDIYSNYLDCHLYIFKKWTLKYLQEKTKIKSIKGELIPSLIRKQFKTSHNSFKKSEILTGDNKVNIFDLVEKDNISEALERLETFNDLKDNLMFENICKIYPDNPIKCCVLLSNDHICVRANQIFTYFESNKQCKRIFQKTEIASNTENQTLTSKKQVGSDCVVGFSTSIKEKTSIKKSIIGNNCNIGEKVKISNCLLMDGVCIQDNCNIQSSILCKGVEIGKSADIKDCIISERQTVTGLTKLTNEVIRDDDHLLHLN